MNRAEMRRLAKQKGKKTRTYTLTQGQIDELKYETVQRAVDVTRALMVAVPANILANCYWEKTAKKRMPTFLSECESLYESIEAGTISINELIQDTMELAGLQSEYFDRLKEDKELWEGLKMGE